MKRLRAREGDFIESIDGLIFDVKGLVHPPDKIIAYLRYIEDSKGTRRRGGRIYRRIYPLKIREELLKVGYPQYLFYDPVFDEHLQGVPKDRIKRIYEPPEKTASLLDGESLDPVEERALGLIHTIHDASGVNFDKIGVSGSLLVDLQTESSDLDMIIYGRENCFAVYEALKMLMRGGGCRGLIEQYTLKDLKRLYKFRSGDMSTPLMDFLKVERRRFMQGKFMGRDFFIRFILDWDEVDEEYGDRRYVSSGYARIKAKVEDASQSIFTPCRYSLSNVRILSGRRIQPLKEVVSFRGRFCEQARNGELIVAQGKVEQVIEKDGTRYYRLLLGGKPSDFMINMSLR